ncbi:MAG: sulfurtransferase [Chloroflexi bacterium]|nr:sulfurtransferase [Chloroflexota bacterium]MBU1750691.1 sulfurtransferase [Chloroflexota bacterium]MBU1879664.1 sulfurtransferase [Chloroflexota bacterium]
MAKEYPYGQGIVKWVSTVWLGQHLEDRDLLVLDTQPNVHDYIQEHIPGAVYMNEGLLRVPLKGLPAQYAPPEAVQAILRRVGLQSGVPVVVYTGVGPFKGWGDGLEQTMVAYSLARFGHDHVYILDGGIDKWKAEGRRLAQEFPQVQESDFAVRVHREYAVEYDEFKAIKDREDVILLDARPPTVYEGQGPWRKPGHIPGAINLPWTNLMAPGNTRLLKPDEEIQAILDRQGVTPDKTIICSCGTGREASNEFILFKWYLDFPRVRIYEGSFTEWTAYPENPTVTGKNPR